MTQDPDAPEVGVFPIDADNALWRVWAPKAGSVDLILDPKGAAERVAMRREGHGYFVVESTLPAVGRRYAYSLDGGAPKPDPASRWQPDGINEPSAVYFAEQFPWDEGDYAGVDRGALVFYELHVGTFTHEGTFDAVIPRVDALKALGVTAIEVMPVVQFPGVRSWGYDGVHPLAVQHSYGGPEALQRFVQACHRKGMAVVLDVIHNHFGPDGLVLTDFGDYLTDRYKTDWGPAVNYDGPGCDAVRSLALQSVRQWVRDFRFDGLRFDAADQIFDKGPRHILGELAGLAHEEAARLGRKVHVFAETDLNDAPRFLHPSERGGYGFDGHWNDDFHHALHVVLTGETNGYYEDFADGPGALAKVFEHVFVNNGTYSPFRKRRHGAPADEFAADRFVAFSQNHDQVGNRRKSDRYAASLPASAARLAAGLVLLAPRLPLLFMGEEYGETNPFPFFCDFLREDLIETVREGRKKEFAYFGWTGEVPDPFDPATRESAVLSWSWDDPRRAGLRHLYADLLSLRRSVRGLGDSRHARATLHPSENGASVLEVVRGVDVDEVTIVFNLAGDPRPIPGRLDGLEPTFRSEIPRYGGGDEDADPANGLRPREFMIFGRPPVPASGAN